MFQIFSGTNFLSVFKIPREESQSEQMSVISQSVILLSSVKNKTILLH